VVNTGLRFGIRQIDKRK